MSMWQNPEVRRKVVGFAVETVTDLARDFVATKPWIRKTDSPPVAVSEGHSDCVTCTIYQEVALARAYVGDLRTKVLADGMIPKGLGGTLAQAQTHIDTAQAQLPKVLGLNPEIDAACMKLGQMLPDISTRLIWVENGPALDHINLLLTQAGTIAYSIPEAMYRVKELIPSETILTAEIITPEDKELLQFLRDLRSGEGSTDDLKMRMLALLANVEAPHVEPTITGGSGTGNSGSAPEPELSPGSLRETGESKPL